MKTAPGGKALARRPAKRALRIGCAGWSLPRAHAQAFATQGSHLERYASVFNAAEINSSFYRSHQPQTYARWASSVPAEFRFSVKVPREISHLRRLRACAKPLARFLDEVGGLGSRLGVLLIQLPPSLAFDRRVVRTFFGLLRRHYGGDAVVEPRNLSWFAAAVEPVLDEFAIGRVASDPAICAAAAIPIARSGLAYWRLHGSPRMYFSRYDDDALRALAERIADEPATQRWCLFDNTAHGHATADALRLIRLTTPRTRIRAR